MVEHNSEKSGDLDEKRKEREARERDREEVIELVRAGVKIKDIPSILGIKIWKVRKICRDAGLHSKWNTMEIRKTRLSNVKLDELKERVSPRVYMAVRLAKEGKSDRETAEIMGISLHTAKRYIHLGLNPEYRRKMRSAQIKSETKKARKELLETIQNLRPSTREAVLKVFSDMLEVN